MADFEPSALRGQTGTATAGVIDQGLRAYMLRVYNYMAFGLAITGVVAYLFFNLSAVVDPATGTLTGLTDFGATLYTSPLRWVVMLAPLGMVFVLSFGMQRMSAGTAQLLFWVFSGVMGVSLSTILMVYTYSSVAQVFFITAAAFAGLSLWGYTTKSDLTAFGSFLIMGLFGLIMASLVNLFMQSSMMSWVISVAGVGIFAGLTAYDTQKIKEMYYVGDDGSVAQKKAVVGALALYLDFINMFLYLLRLFGSRR
jgi:FtsH-binding integral membrane protein